MLPVSIPNTTSKCIKPASPGAHLQGFTPVSHQFLCCPNKLSQGAMLTYLTLCSFDYVRGAKGERKGYVFPSNQKLASMRGLSERTIRGHVQQLVRAGYLVRVRRRNQSSVLTLKEPAVEELKSPSQSENRERQFSATAYIGNRKKEKKIEQHVVDEDLLEKLLRIGVTENRARGLCTSYSASHILDKLDLLSHQLKRTEFGATIRNPAAWIVKAIENNYQNTQNQEPVEPAEPAFKAEEYELVIDENGYEVFRPRSQDSHLLDEPATMQTEKPTDSFTNNCEEKALRRYYDCDRLKYPTPPPNTRSLVVPPRNLTIPPSALYRVGWSGSRLGFGGGVGKVVLDWLGLGVSLDWRRVVMGDDVEGMRRYEDGEEEVEEGGSGGGGRGRDKVNDKKKKERKERKDKGKVQVTRRDIWALDWIGEMSTVRVDQLQRLLGREAQADTKTEGELGTKTIERILRRWQRLGLGTGSEDILPGAGLCIFD
jgi:DNA-binding transcriptional regulator YhcF (GntR family)